MFERYTEAARRVLFFARYEATQAGGAAIAPEHVLLGLTRESSASGGAHGVFSDAGISLETIRAGVAGVMGQAGLRPTTMEIPFTAATKKVLLFAGEEADALQQRDITPRHLLLGILREGESESAHLLMRLGLTLGAARTTTVQATNAGESGHAPPSLSHHAALIPPSTEVRVSISTRRGTSSTRGLHHWFLEGFSFVNAVAKIYDFPASRIECPDHLANRGPYDIFLMLPVSPIEPPHPNVEGAMRSALERYFAIEVSRQTRPTAVLVLSAPDGSSRARQISLQEVGGMSAWTTEWTEEGRDVPFLPDEQRRRHFEARLRMFAEGRGMMLPGGSTAGPSALSGSLSMARLCETLELALGRCVVDETGLPGTFEIDLRADRPDADALRAALRERLGLALTPGEREVAFLVVTPA
jgi:uncharacterized protein (TIGR03435 family)